MPSRYSTGKPLLFMTERGSAIVKKLAEEHRAGVHTGGSGTIIYGLAGVIDPAEAQFILPEGKDPKNWRGGHLYDFAIVRVNL